MNDSHNYLGSNNWWSTLNFSATNTGTFLKIVPPPTGLGVASQSIGAALVTAQTADAGSTQTTVRDAARTEADDFWNGKLIRFTSGALAGQSRIITDFLAATDDIVYDPLTAAGASAGDLYDIFIANMANRLVITGYHISGNNSNAAQATVLLRCYPTTTVSILRASLNITNGNYSADAGGVWIPLPADESIQVVVAGALTGNVDITVWGKVFPISTHLAGKYDGTA
jgi:hypothetical protein